MEEYMNIYRRLTEKPTSIENIIEIREWMETVPLTVRGHDDSVRKYILVCDFFYI